MEIPFSRQMGNKAAYSLKLQEHLYDQLLSQSEFCDVALEFGTTEMKAHWCVLVSCPYFQSLYDSEMTEKREGKIRISVGKPTAVRAAISFLYNGILEVKYESVKELLEVADYFQIEDLKKACSDYLASVEVNLENCISLSLLASLYDLDIYGKVYDYVRGHLPEVMLQEETLSLTAESVIVLLNDRALNYVSADDYFKFIVKWVETDRDVREKYFNEMFCALDLKKVSKDFLEKTVESYPLVSSSQECTVHLLNHKMKIMAGLLSNDSHRDVILLVGGCGQGQYFHTFLPFFPLSDTISVNNVYGYIVDEDRWTELAPLPYQMRRPLVTFEKETSCLYVYDSSSGGPIENDIILLFKFSVLEKSWTSVRINCEVICEDLTIHSIQFCNGRLYMVASGRFADDCATHSAHIEWQCCVLMANEDMTRCEMRGKLFPRTLKTVMNICTVEDQYLCIMGYKCATKGTGKTRKMARFLYLDTKSGRKFDLSKGAFYEPIMFPVKGELYFTKPGCYRMRKFNFSTRKWITLKELCLPHPKEEPRRTDYIHTIYKDRFFVLGGKSPATKKQIDNACQFSLTDKTWTNIEVLPQSLTNSGVVVASIPEEHVRCHIDCPHCKFNTVRNQASYHIEYPEEDEDECDVSYDEEELYSDYWDDDVYDPFDPYDIY